jgi:hypothetical protein
MTSLQLHSGTRLEPRPVYEWGTGELKGEKFDPTLITSPTFLLRYLLINLDSKNQTNYYI